MWTTSSNNYTVNPQTHAHWENEIQRAILNAIGAEQVLLDFLLSEAGILMTKLAMELMTLEIEGKKEEKEDSFKVESLKVENHVCDKCGEKF